MDEGLERLELLAGLDGTIERTTRATVPRVFSISGISVWEMSSSRSRLAERNALPVELRAAK